MSRIGTYALFVVTLAGLVAGCGKSELVRQAEQLRDEMCACDAPECAKGAFEKVKSWDDRNRGARVTKGDNEAIFAAMVAADKCYVEVAQAAHDEATEDPSEP